MTIPNVNHLPTDRPSNAGRIDPPQQLLKITSIGPDQRGAFAGLWVPWLKDTIGVVPEPEDLEVMADPATYYARSGGEAFLALLDDQVVGAVAVKGLGAPGFEFCKLVVSEAARGRGAGRALVDTCIDYATRHGGKALYLQSFEALDVALGLYARMGFTTAAAPREMAVLARTEVIMSRAL
jgi:putative acetyltransferase